MKEDIKELQRQIDLTVEEGENGGYRMKKHWLKSTLSLRSMDTRFLQSARKSSPEIGIEVIALADFDDEKLGKYQR